MRVGRGRKLKEKGNKGECFTFLHRVSLFNNLLPGSESTQMVYSNTAGSFNSTLATTEQSVAHSGVGAVCGGCQ